jgi:hypothetical protein
METEGSLPHLEEPAWHLSLFWTRSTQSMHPSHFLKIHFNISLLSTPVWSSYWSINVQVVSHFEVL